MTETFRGPFTGIYDIHSAIQAQHPAMHAVGYCTCHRKKVQRLIVLFALASEAKRRAAHD